MRRSRTCVPAALSRAAAQFNRRRVRGSGRRLPPKLWKQAVGLARQFGISRTAHALGLNYTRLKELTEPKATLEALPTPEPVPRFVEVLGSGGLAGVQGVLELERADGSRARLRLPGGSWDDWCALAQSLWGATPCSK
jgi:hypothetical protein